MRSTILAAMLAATLAAGCAATVSGDAYGPDLVTVSPGVQVIADYDEPIFYSDGFYWRYYGGVWYRSTYYTGGWVYARPPVAVLRVDRPYAYVHYRPAGWAGHPRTAAPGWRGSPQPARAQSGWRGGPPPVAGQPAWRGSAAPAPGQPGWRGSAPAPHPVTPQARPAPPHGGPGRRRSGWWHNGLDRRGCRRGLRGGRCRWRGRERAHDRRIVQQLLQLVVVGARHDLFGVAGGVHEVSTEGIGAGDEGAAQLLPRRIEDAQYHAVVQGRAHLRVGLPLLDQEHQPALGPRLDQRRLDLRGRRPIADRHGDHAIARSLQAVSDRRREVRGQRLTAGRRHVEGIAEPAPLDAHEGRPLGAAQDRGPLILHDERDGQRPPRHSRATAVIDMLASERAPTDRDRASDDHRGRLPLNPHRIPPISQLTRRRGT